MTLIYLTVEGISSTVFESQVSSYIKQLKANQYHPLLIIGQKYKSRVSFKKTLSLFIKKDVKFIFINSVIDHIEIAKKVIKKIGHSKPIIIHCRNVEAAYIGLLVKEELGMNVQVIYDVRGYVEGEKAFFNELEREQLFKTLNNKLFKSDIYFSFVSRELYELYNKEYHIPLSKTIFCNSAYNDKIFKMNLNKLKDTSKIKILFVGGNQTYQKTQEIISILKNNNNLELTVVTPKPLTINENTNNVILLNGLSQKEISNLSDDFDYGVIYRSSELFNEVATPTKISEYLGKGLKILAINSAGAYTKDILENKILGCVLKTEAELLTMNLKKVTFDEKKIISEYAKQHFSLSKNIEKYTQLYKKIYESIQKGHQ